MFAGGRAARRLARGVSEGHAKGRVRSQEQRVSHSPGVFVDLAL